MKNTESEPGADISAVTEHEMHGMVLDGMEDLVVLQDHDGRYVYVTPSVTKRLGYLPEEIIGRYPTDYVHRDDIETIYSNARKLTITNPRFEVEYRIRNSKGEYLWFSSIISLIQDWSTGTFKYLTSARDVTEKHRLQEELSLSSFSMEKAIDMIYWINAEGRIIHVNDSVVSILGYSREKILTLMAYDIDLNLTGENWDEQWSHLETEGSNKLETLLRACNGTLVPVELSINYHVSDSGGIAFVFAVDITERKMMEEERRSNLTFLTTLINNVPIVLFAKDPKGRYLLFNKTGEDILGVRASDIIGKTDYDHFTPDVADDYHSRDMNILTYGTPDIIPEQRVNTPNGWRTLRTIKVPVFESSGDHKYIIGFSEDITEEKKREEEFRILARYPEDNPNPVIRTNSEGTLLYSNRAASTLLEIWNCRQGDRLPAIICSSVKEILQSGRSREIEISAERSIYSFFITPLIDEHMVYLYGTDITERKMVEAQFQLAIRVLETTSEGIVITDSDANIMNVNPAFTSITGYTREEAAGKNPRILKSDRHNHEFYENMWQSIKEKGQWEGEIWNRRKNGETYPEWLSINTIHDENGKVKYYVSIFRDISELKEKEERIHHQAYHDPLTSLPNRNLFNDRVSLAISHAHRYNEKLALLFIDMDRFKLINDTLGHIIGDFILQKAAEKLISCVREDDTVARIGGDEFVILLPNISGPNVAVTVANRIIETFKLPSRVRDHELFITPSIGISLYPSDAENASDLFRSADMAMYHAKGSGGNRYQFYSEKMNEIVSRQMQVGNQLRRALERNEMVLHFQPIIRADNGRISGVEALVRWNSPNMGLVSPSEFIQHTIETGQIIPLNRWVLNEACRYGQSWYNRGFTGLTVSVNTTSHQFKDRQLLNDVREALQNTGFPARNLTIEITESSFMTDMDESLELIREIKAMGVKFSIDDFGTGYSSLSYLKKLSMNSLKIDRSFVTGLPGEIDSAIIARTIITLAHSLNLSVIAEGVETIEQRNFLKENGCDYFQGYYYSRPVTDLELDEILLR